MSVPKLARTTLIIPLTVNKKIKPIAKRPVVLKSIEPLHNTTS